MHAFPPREALLEFEGDAIAQIWLDPFAVRFRFESMTEIYAALRIEHREPDGRLWAYDCMAAEGPSLILHRLLSKKIVAVDREDLRLTLEIEDGSSLSIMSELGPYESGHLTTAQGGFLVF